MAIYEYARANRHEVELMRPIEQRDAAVTCPKCKAAGHRLLSVFGATNGPYVRAAGTAAYRGEASVAPPPESPPTNTTPSSRGAAQGTPRGKKKK